MDWPELVPELLAADDRRARPDCVERLERARTFMDAHYGDALDLALLAKVACLSPFHFARVFRLEYGQTPHGYLTSRRIERAKALLLETNQSITEVGMGVGFKTPASFSRAFSQRVGSSPRRFRRRIVQVQWTAPPRIPWCFRFAWIG